MRTLALAVALLAAAPHHAVAADRGTSGERGAAQGGIERLGPPPPRVAARVVSLAPSATDIVVALGLADRLVGVTRFDNGPEVARVARVGGFLDPSTEAVVALHPDLVLWITDAGAAPAVRRLAELGVPVLAVPVIGVEDVLAATRAIASALGAPEAGEREAARLQQAIDRTRARSGGLARPRVLFVVGREPLVLAGPGSYPDALLGIVGARNAMGGKIAWPVVPVETAVGLDPDLVVDAAVNEHGGTGDGGLSAIPAVRRGAIVRLPDDAALRPGPRLVHALEELFRGVHPERR
jgi:iron complex transport system substrate-binding protein